MSLKNNCKEICSLLNEFNVYMDELPLKNEKDKKLNFIFANMVTLFSAFIYSLGVVVFISNAKLMASGVSGMSLIIGRLIADAELIGFNEAQISGVFYFIINIPVLILSFKKFSFKFTYLFNIFT